MSNRQEFIVVDALPPVTEHVVDGYNNGGMLLTYETFDVSGDSPEMREASGFRDAQKEAFLAGSTRNPVLNNCPNFHLQRGWRRGLYMDTAALMYTKELRYADGAEGGLEDRLLDRNIALRINELGFVETAALIAGGNVGEDERAGLARVLKEAARGIYGLPDRDRALSLIDTRLKKARKISVFEGNPAAGIARELLGMVKLPKFKRVPEEVDMDDSIIEYYQGFLKDAIGEAVVESFTQVGEREEFSVDEIKTIFQYFLDARGYSQRGWRAEIIPNRTACATKANEAIVEIGEKRPKSRRAYEEVLKSEVHEAEVHTGRQARGAELGSGLAEFGLAGYGVFEEPFASTVADIYVGKVTNAGTLPAIAIALAVGFDGHERDFRDSFEIFWRLNLMKAYKEDKPLEDQIKKVKDSVYATLVRIWRGMPTDVPGCVFPKDRMYDNADVVDYLNNHGNPLPREDFLRLLEAKYNPLDPDQDEYIRGLTS